MMLYIINNRRVYKDWISENNLKNENLNIILNEKLNY